MFEVNWLIGAAPGQGKTAAVRVLGCGAALDPLADLWIHELAGKGDLEPFAQVCHRYCSGLDDESIAYAAESARMLRNETERRSAMFKKLKGTGLMPDGKLTRELAAKYQELRPIVAIFDEVQNVLHAPGARQPGRRGPRPRDPRSAAPTGIIVVLATQRPDEDPSRPRSAAVVVPVLPEGPRPGGQRPGPRHRRVQGRLQRGLFRPKIDAGLGWLKARDGDPQIVRTYYLDLNATRRSRPGPAPCASGRGAVRLRAR